ncbi:MAG: UvrD-helicase domain-containing protein [Patescibacteria group bacterium]|jgi:DNA helicase-2/ATP-dependent DNA helicase PcrA
MDYSAFVSKSKCFVIAPAGYGKTHAIAECLKYVKGKQLILTHTHAGVASLKEKIQNLGVSSEKYRVETISSYAQKYVNAFYCGNDIPKQEDGKNYYPFIIDKAKSLFGMSLIQDVIKATYTGLFVDEYQDCNIGQHYFVKALANILPTRLFGDPLQGIFDFNGDTLVDFDKDLSEFERFPDLSTPWRWKDNNPKLGDVFKDIRDKLIKKQCIDLSLYNSHIEILAADNNQKIWELVRNDSVLIINPNSSKISDRMQFIKKLNYSFRLVEAIDHRDFYSLACKLDELKSSKNLYEGLMFFLKGEPVKKKSRITRKNTLLTGLAKYFPDDKKFPNSKAGELRSIIDSIKNWENNKSFSLLAKIFREIKKLNGVNCYRSELFFDLCEAIEYAEHKSISIYEAMKEIRNRTRRVGRKVTGRCVGTTLLTKGLEFDTVAILDVHSFKCLKNFYVAITRASKKLIIFTNKRILFSQDN